MLVLGIVGSLAEVALLRGLMCRATIVEDEQSISASMFGIRTKTIQWANVVKIRKERTPNGYAYVDSFHIVASDQASPFCRYFANLCGNIVFTQEIKNLPALIDRVNLRAQHYEIPIFVWDLEVGSLKRATGGHAKSGERQVLQLRIGSEL